MRSGADATGLRRVAYSPHRWARLLLGLLVLAVTAGCAQVASQPARFVRQVEWAGRGVWLKVDTHTHTQFSDGAHTVDEVVAKAAQFGCDVVAITDHADRELSAATHEYAASIEAARDAHPDIIVLAGVEWNIPPWGGDEHVVVLMPPGAKEGQLLAEFKQRFDDLGADDHDPSRADEALEWLAATGATSNAAPVLIYEHPSRKRERSRQIVSDLRRWRAVNDLVIGFSGAPGHQGMKPLGSYKSALQSVDRWDPAVATVGDAWDALLQRGVDVWAAYAPSDFHDADPNGLADYWPGQFSETWLYAPDRSAKGALQALRAGSFFAVHGHVVRQVEILVDAPGLPRAAGAGECIEAPADTDATVEVRCQIPPTDWNGEANRLDSVELIAITVDGARVIATAPPAAGDTVLREAVRVPTGGITLRARGRRVSPDGPDLLFYTNPVRIRDASQGPSALSPTPRVAPIVSSDGQGYWQGHASLAGGFPWVIGGAICLGLLAGGLAMHRRTSTASEISQLLRACEKRAVAPRRVHFLLVAIGFTTFAIYGSLVPLHYRPVALDAAVDAFRRVPYLHIGIVSRSDWVANILLFVPIGFFWLATWTVDRTAWVVWAVAAPLVVLSGATLSVAIEFTQIWFPPRTVSQNDILAECIGAAVGATIWLAAGPMFTAWCRSFTSNRRSQVRFDWLVQAYVIGLWLYNLLPLDLTISPVEIVRKYREGKFLLVPFTNLGIWSDFIFGSLVDVILFAPVGVVATTIGLRACNGARSVARATCLGALFVVVVEVSQIFVYSRYCDTSDLFVGTLGVWLGAWACHRWGGVAGRGARRDLASRLRENRLALPAIALAYATILVIVFWSPFRLVDDPRLVEQRWSRFFSVPLSSMYWGSEYNAVTQFLRKSLFFLPFGALLEQIASYSRKAGAARRLKLTLAVLAALSLALVIELGQLWLSQSSADSTDVMLYFLGALAGIVLSAKLSNPRPLAVDEASGSSRERAIDEMESGQDFPPTARADEKASQGWMWGAAIFGLALLLSVAWIASEARQLAQPPVSIGTEYRDPSRVGVPDLNAPSAEPFTPLDSGRLNVVFTPVPDDVERAPRLERIDLPDFPGAYAIWGATGRDQGGHIWLGVSASGVPFPSAHLLELDPRSGRIVDRGDAVSELKRNFTYRRGEGQMKIHSKIFQAADGYLYFATMDEQGEREDGSRLPDWGSHLWRLQPGQDGWEHLMAVPEALIAVAGSDQLVYALGYFDHVLYQWDCRTRRARSVHVGSVGGHISRNFVCDHRGHVYAPRLRWSSGPGTEARVSLVELDASLQERGETPLEHYLPTGNLLSHGIVGVQPLADGSIVFVTHVGFLYRIRPRESTAAEVSEVGWFNPRGKSYVASLFTWTGKRFLMGAGQGHPFEWLLHDLELGASRAFPLAETRPYKDLLLYGSATRDDDGRFYLVGSAQFPLPGQLNTTAVRSDDKVDEPRSVPLVLRATLP